MEIEKLNESVDDIFNNLASTNNTNNDINNFSLKKSKKKPSLLSELKNNNDDFVIPKTIEEVKVQNFIEESKKQQEVKPKNVFRLRKPIVKIEETKQEIEEILQQQTTQIVSQQQIEEKLQETLINEYQQNTGEDLPETVDMLEVLEEVKVIVDSLTDEDKKDLTISDFEIINTDKPTGRFGYTKSIITLRPIKDSNFAMNELSELATKVHSVLGGNEIIRKLTTKELNTLNNERLLKNSSVKLHDITYGFRQSETLNKINKGTKIMISISNDFEKNKIARICLTSGSNCYIGDVDWDIEFLVKIICQYTIVGFEATKLELKNYRQNSPITQFANKYMLTNNYIIKKVSNSLDGNERILMKHRSTINSWMTLLVERNVVTEQFSLIMLNDYDKKFARKVSSKDGITIQKLLDSKTMETIEKLFHTDFNSELGTTSDNKIYYMYKKLTYSVLKKSFDYLLNLGENDIELGLEIKETLSQLDTSKSLNDYKCESIIGKTNFLDYFILSVLAVQIESGDTKNRATKYGDRNYHARKNMFQIVYSIDNVQYNKIGETLQDILDKTNFLSKTPIKNP